MGCDHQVAGRTKLSWDTGTASRLSSPAELTESVRDSEVLYYAIRQEDGRRRPVKPVRLTVVGPRRGLTPGASPSDSQLDWLSTATARSRTPYCRVTALEPLYTNTALTSFRLVLCCVC